MTWYELYIVCVPSAQYVTTMLNRNHLHITKEAVFTYQADDVVYRRFFAFHAFAICTTLTLIRTVMKKEWCKNIVQIRLLASHPSPPRW